MLFAADSPLVPNVFAIDADRTTITKTGVAGCKDDPDWGIEWSNNFTVRPAFDVANGVKVLSFVAPSTCQVSLGVVSLDKKGKEPDPFACHSVASSKRGWFITTNEGALCGHGKEESDPAGDCDGKVVTVVADLAVVCRHRWRRESGPGLVP